MSSQTYYKVARMIGIQFAQRIFMFMKFTKWTDKIFSVNLQSAKFKGLWSKWYISSQRSISLNCHEDKEDKWVSVKSLVFGSALVVVEIRIKMKGRVMDSSFLESWLGALVDEILVPSSIHYVSICEVGHVLRCSSEPWTVFDLPGKK